MPWIALASVAAGYLLSRKETKAQKAVGEQRNVLDYELTIADIKAKKEIFLEQLEFDREKFEFLKTQAQGPLGQTGSYGYPYVSVKQSESKPGLLSIPLIIGIGLAYVFIKKGSRAISM